MFRRLACTNPIRSRALAESKRTYFNSGGGEEGISAATMKKSIQCVYVAWVVGFIFCYKVIFGYYSPKRQWLYETTDLFDDDGTVMEGEEAIANLRIAHERIMPYMDDIKAQMDALEGAPSE